MKRVIASLLMTAGVLFASVVPAQASHNMQCTEVWIHFRPAYCTDKHDGYTWIWVCPDRWGGCFLVYGPMN